MAEKKRKGLLGGSIRPHTSAFNCCTKFGMTRAVLEMGGRVTNLPCEQPTHGCFRKEELIPFGETNHILNYSVIHIGSWVS